MNKPVRTTLIYGLLSGLAMIPVLWHHHVQGAYGAWPTALELAIWCDLAVYTLLLCRWSRTRLPAVLFPLALLLGVVVWPRAHAVFLLMAMGTFSWIRSGICFNNTPLRALTAELVTVGGGILWIIFWWPQATVSWALAVWLFFLVQSLYFFIIPPNLNTLKRLENQDPFEQARREAERLLETG